MIDGTAAAEQTGDAFVAGDIGRYRPGTQIARNRIQAVGIA
jgi:hypothetical protein